MNPNKEHIHQVILFQFNTKKSAAEAARIINEVYPESVDDSTCRRWYQKFKKGDFGLEDKQRTGRPTIIDLEKLKAILELDPYQTLHELAEKFNCSYVTISNQLH